MKGYDLPNPTRETARDTLRAMANAIDAGQLHIDRIALYGEENGFAPQRFDFTMSGRAEAPAPPKLAGPSL